MPTYTFKDKDTQAVFDKQMPMSEREQYLKDNPNLEQLIVNPLAIGDSIRLGLRKPDDGFRDALREVKKKHKHNTINVI
jgi:hypothetical protein